MKCYLMYHIHVFEDETKDYKIIGVFTSYDKALDVKGKYSSELVGFKDYPSGFCIEEFFVCNYQYLRLPTFLYPLARFSKTPSLDLAFVDNKFEKLPQSQVYTL